MTDRARPGHDDDAVRPDHSVGAGIPRWQKIVGIIGVVVILVFVLFVVLQVSGVIGGPGGHVPGPPPGGH
jgi:hypothetical protein